MQPSFALVDCNNFYVSCERLFRPDLQRTPIVVLSNNDGCIVSRSAEVKALGIPMAEPLFKVQRLLQQHGVKQFSSNYALYGDISSRVMSVLEALAPEVEVYSIDEAFVDVSHIAKNQRTALGQHMRQRIKRWVGVPVCVGIGPTKTLAKLANHAAKSNPASGGVLDLSSRSLHLRTLTQTPVREIWGIGSRLNKKLASLGVYSAMDLARSDPNHIRQQFSVQVERTLLELRGIPCFDLDSNPAPHQQILCSRSFGERVNQIHHLRQAVCEYAARASEKLRQQNLHARQVSVFIRTHSHPRRTEGYRNSACIELLQPSQDSREIIQAAGRALAKIYRPNLSYVKAGVMLGSLTEKPHQQTDWLTEANKDTTQPGQKSPRNSARLMQTLDQINQSKLGKVFFAGQGIQQPWYMHRDFLSPRYTTKWQDLPQVN